MVDHNEVMKFLNSPPGPDWGKVMYRTQKKVEGTEVEVNLIDKSHTIIAQVKVIQDKQGRMPPLLIVLGETRLNKDRYFVFDNGMEHCGERYHEVEPVMLSPERKVFDQGAAGPDGT